MRREHGSWRGHGWTTRALPRIAASITATGAPNPPTTRGQNRTRVCLLLLATLVSAALAQAPAAATPPDATLLFDLLGSVNAITVDLTEEVREVLVVGMHAGVVHVAVESAIDATAGPGRVEITAGGVTAVGRCAATAFARIVHVDADGRARGGRSSMRCFDEADPHQFVKLPTGSPLFFVGSVTELPLDTWLVFEAMRVGAPPLEVPSDAFVFYLYLNTAGDRQGVGTPDYDTWAAAARAFDLPDE